MSARQRRRRRSTPRRRARRWLRRQDRLTRGLMAAVALLSILVLALFALLQDERRGPERAARPAEPESLVAAPAPRPRQRVAARAAPAPTPAPPAGRSRSATHPGERPGRQAGARGDGTPLPSLARPAAPAPPHASPRAAIVIDDLGQRFSHFEQVAALELPLSIAVIPGLPASARTVREASARGIELLVHQPMEPHEAGGKDAGQGVLLSAMTEETLRERLRAGIAAVPGAVGMNNHMGSRFTEDAGGLAAVMAELKGSGLFWLDSRTTGASRGLEAAGAAGVPAVGRDVFLDAEVDAAFVRAQVRRLLEIARARGTAVGIGHPHPETLGVLLEMREELLASGVRLVPVSRLVSAGAPEAPEAAPAVASRPPERTAAAPAPVKAPTP